MDKQYLNCTASTSNNFKSDGIKFQFDNSKFDLSDSETSISFGSLDEESLAVKDSEENDEKLSQALNYFDNSSAKENEAKICFHEVLAKASKSNAYIKLSSSDLLLKKSTKIMNFNFAEFKPDRLLDDADSKCAVEILTAANDKKPTTNRHEISSTHANEEKIVAMDVISASPILKNRSYEKGRNPAFLEAYEGPDQSDMETENASDNISQRSHFFDDRNVNFFVKKRGKTQKSKFTQKRVKFSDNEKSVMTGKRVLDSEVPPEKDIEIKLYLRDFYFYFIFLIFMTTIALCMVSSNMFYSTDLTLALFFNIPSTSVSKKSENLIRALNLQFVDSVWKDFEKFTYD